eukprot:scaffold304_cov248-Pinguiococcus_pyrenoidosus.AAC.24
MLSREDDAAKTAFYYVLTAAGTSAITATTLGYDVGIMADAAEGIKTHFSIDDATNELIIGSLNFVSAFGALLGGPMADSCCFWLHRVLAPESKGLAHG